MLTGLHEMRSRSANATLYTHGNEALNPGLQPAISMKGKWIVEPRVIKRLEKGDGDPLAVELEDGTSKKEKLSFTSR